jgi:hypothetical protein
MQLVDRLRLLQQGWAVRRLFDAAFYLERYPDVRQAGMNPLWHYLRHGAAEGRKPHRLFEPDYYLSCCPEARDCANPLLHFIETGGRLGNPHPLFDCNAYLVEHPDVGLRGVNPLLHYIEQKKAARGTGPFAYARGNESATRGSRADGGVRSTRLEILDVTVDVAFWEDADGRLSFIVEPQQRPFFRAMRFDQLSAQVKP